MFYLFLTLAVWFGYTLLSMFSIGEKPASPDGTDTGEKQNNFWICMLSMLSLALLAVPSLLRLGC